jgi:hypothetical protein
MTTPAVKKTTANNPVKAGIAGPGRPKGIPNKNTIILKDMILQALEGAGGVDYLQERAQDPRTASAFLGLVGKVLPMAVTGPDGGAIQTVTRIELVAMRGDD